MKNYEKYAEEIKNYYGETFCRDFIIPNILKENGCSGECSQCRLLQTMWLFEEYEEPEVDWSQVSVDTPILVRDYENEEWNRRYFAKYENGLVYTWMYGYTSWTIIDGHTETWPYAKLAETEKGE